MQRLGLDVTVIEGRWGDGAYEDRWAAARAAAHALPPLRTSCACRNQQACSLQWRAAALLVGMQGMRYASAGRPSTRPSLSGVRGRVQHARLPDPCPHDWLHCCRLAEVLQADTEKKIKAVCVVHNETTTGVTSDIPEASRPRAAPACSVACTFRQRSAWLRARRPRQERTCGAQLALGLASGSHNVAGWPLPLLPTFCPRCLPPRCPRQVRKTLDAAGHPALLLVDGVSSIGALDFQFDAWRVDVAVTGSQKALSIPTGLAMVCASEKALAAMKTATSRWAQRRPAPRSGWPHRQRQRRPPGPVPTSLCDSLARPTPPSLLQACRPAGAPDGHASLCAPSLPKLTPGPPPPPPTGASTTILPTCCAPTPAATCPTPPSCRCCTAWRPRSSCWRRRACPTWPRGTTGAPAAALAPACCSSVVSWAGRPRMLAPVCRAATGPGMFAWLWFALQPPLCPAQPHPALPLRPPCPPCRLAEGCRRAVEGWGLQTLCRDPRWKSDSLTVIEVPAGVDSQKVVDVAYAK